jgi:hypothetical protein
MSKKDDDVTCSEDIKDCLPVFCFAKIGRRMFSQEIGVRMMFLLERVSQIWAGRAVIYTTD